MARKHAERRELAGSPDIHELSDAYDFCVRRRNSSVYRRQQQNVDSRTAWWRGQSPDGRKWARNYGHEVFPWEGGNDSRVHLTDRYVKEDVDLLMLAWQQMRVSVLPTETHDTKRAGLQTNFLRWLLYTQIPAAEEEMELAANYLLERGSVGIGVFWNRRTQLARHEITLEDAQRMAVQAQAALTQGLVPRGASVRELELAAQFPEMLLDPAQDEALGEMLRQVHPHLKPGRARKAIRDLREEGLAGFPVPHLRHNEPRLVALALNDDLFLPPEASGLEDNPRYVFWRELLPETELAARVEDEGWDESWVQKVIRTQRGQMTLPEVGQTRQRSRWGRTGEGVHQRNYYEVVHAYERLADSDGIPGIYYTVFHPRMINEGGHRNLHGAHELLNYDHGDYPFVIAGREVRSRVLDDSRGYGEIADTWQRAVKTEWDFRADRASITTLPPWHHPPGQAPNEWGPGAKIPTTKPEAHGFMEAPRIDPGSERWEQTVREFADGYFGRVTDPKNPGVGRLVRQRLVSRWLRICGRVGTQVLQLAQQFAEDEIYFRVVGTAQGQGIRATREEIQGRFDLQVTFQAENMEPEVKKLKLDFLERALNFDVGGLTDRSETLSLAYDIIEPGLGERLVKPAESASQQEAEDERDIYAQLRAGVDVDIKPGQAHELRAKVLQELLLQDPEALREYDAEGRFREVFDKRMKQHMHQLQQRQNAVIGRLGA